MTYPLKSSSHDNDGGDNDEEGNVMLQGAKKDCLCGTFASGDDTDNTRVNFFPSFFTVICMWKSLDITDEVFLALICVGKRFASLASPNISIKNILAL